MHEDSLEIIPTAPPPNAFLYIARIKIGPTVLEGISAPTADAVEQIRGLIKMVHEETRPRRIRKGSTRYRDQIPEDAPARLLSIEVQDYIRSARSRGLKKAPLTTSNALCARYSSQPATFRLPKSGITTSLRCGSF